MDNATVCVNEDHEKIKRLSDSNCKEIIKNSINKNKTFTNVKIEFAFTNPKDNKVLLSYYTEMFLKALSLKTKLLIDELFNHFNENLIVQWANVLYNPRSTKSDMENLLKNAPFYECMIDLRDNNNAVDYSNFYATVKNEFCSTFINFSNFTGILEIFQCLLRCKSLPSPNQSTLFCDTVKLFVRTKCNINDLDLDAENNAKIDPEHFRLAKLVENFDETLHKSIFILIKDIFPSTNISTSYDGNKKIAKIEGYQIIWSKVYNKNPALFEDVDVVEVKAENELILDDNVKLPGITFSLFALNVVATKPLTINLSGTYVHDIMTKAQNGVERGENGENGNDGKAGQSSGNFALVSKSIQGKDNLKIVLNGGKGMNGQDGGDGAQGKDGIGVKFENAFNTRHWLQTGAKQFVNVFTFGTLSRLIDKMIEKQKDDGSFECFNDSPFYFSTHSFSFIRGGDGKPGGKGGKNGIGGQGGKKGKCHIIINNKIENENIAITSEDGEKGSNGHPGKNADFGIDGWDIAVMNSTFGKRIEYGREHNEKLYFKYEETGNENSVYLKDKNCYVTVHRQPCTHKRLKENETEFKSETEISGESIAVDAIDIDISTLMENYHSIVACNETIEVQQDIEAEMNEEINVSRVMELWIDVEEEVYVPKERHKTPIFPEDRLEELDLSNEDEALKLFWKSRTDMPIDELHDSQYDDELLQKLNKKFSLFKLRSLRRDIETYSRKIEPEISQGDLLFIQENYYQYCYVLNTIKKYRIDDKILEYHVPAIEKAFTEKNIGALTIFANKLSTSTDFCKEFPQELFKIFDAEFEACPAAIKNEKAAFRPLFYVVKLFENILINNVFFQSFGSDEKHIESIKTLMILQKRRILQANNFQKKLESLMKEYKFESGIQNDDRLEEKLQIFFEFFNSADTILYLKKELKFICKNFPAVGNAFLNSLLYVFEVEGCHIDIHTLKYLIDTVFDACRMYETFNCLIFPSILLITNQEQWIDQFFIFNVESAFHQRIKNRAEILEILEQFVDENLKILCTQKLYESSEKISVDVLTNLLKAIKSSATLYPQAKEKNLENWIKMMEKISFSQTLDSCDQEWNQLDDKSKNQIKFWCNALIGRFGLEYVQNIKSEIVKLIGYKKDVVGRFIHRLCEDQIFPIDSAQALKNLFEAVLECLNLKNINSTSSRYEYAKSLLSDDKFKFREFENFQQMCEILNKNGYTEILEKNLEILSKDINDNVKARLTSNFQNMAEKLDFNLDISLEECKMKFEKDVSECCNEIDEDLYYLQIVDAVVEKICNFSLRYTQKIAILCALKNYISHGILQQISTGEGKTLIIAVIGIISVLKGRTVNIVTSSPVLARRDASNSYCSKLYKAFGLKVDHICYDSARFRKRVYSKCHIIYGDLTSYQRDFLMDNFYSTNVSSSRKSIIMIVDEVDSLFLDNGLNTLYLSHDIADFEMLYPLIIQLWDEVMKQLKNNGKCHSEKFYQNLCKKLFPIISWQHENYTEIEIELFKKVLIENSIIDEKNNILIKKRHRLLKKVDKIYKNFQNIFDQISANLKGVQITNETDVTLNAALISSTNNVPLIEGEMQMSMLKVNRILDENKKLITTTIQELEEKLKVIKESFNKLLNQDFLFKYDEIMEIIVVDIPHHLRSYVSTHLKEFIENAVIAYNMEADVEYQIDMRFTDPSQKILEPKIIITDRDTGVDLPSTQWHKGLHQFLQLKHGLRLTPLSTKAVFISNISYLKRFECIYGLSGTLGSDTEKQQLHEFYNLKSIVLPSSMVKQFYEEQSIITTSEKHQYQEIFNAIKEKMAEGRSVLVIGDSSKQVSNISKHVKELAKKSIAADEMHSYENAIVYQHDSDKFHYSDGNHRLDKKLIIFATNLAGRGTDILLTDDLKNSGGLHVIIAFLPRNIRIEEQAFGRAARCGERGTAQIIICDKSITDFSSANIVELKGSRDAIEEKRIRKIREHYENKLKVEEDCFQLFNEKFQILNDSNHGKNKSIIIKNILDNWALFLDQSEYEIKEKEKRIKAVKEFCEHLRIDDNDPLLPQNMLMLAISKITEEKYSEALKSMNEIGENFPEYLPEVQYYSFYITIKTNPSPQAFEEGKKELYDARSGFIERQEIYSNHNEIVERHKIVEENCRLERDIFLQQQKESTFLIKNVIESIDILFGQIIEPDSFTTNKICEEASMHLFKQLSDHRCFKKGPPIAEFVIKKQIIYDDLTNYCKYNGLHAETTLNKLENLKILQNITVTDLQNALNIATWEMFWMELAARNYITDIENHMFINVSKLPNLTESKINSFIINTTAKNERIFEHIYVLNDEWKEFDAKEVETILYPELLNLLIKNNIICETKSAILSYRFKEAVNFDSLSFSTVTKEDLMLYDIPETDAMKILNSMEEEGIFMRNANDQFSLLISIERNVTFVSWYHNIVMKMIKQKLTFGLAAKILQDNLSRQKSLINLLKAIPNFVEIDEAFISELIYNGILESTNVNFNNYKKIEDMSLQDQLDGITSISACLKKTKRFINESFDEQNAELIDPKNEYIVIDILKSHASIDQKHSTIDVTLNRIKQKNLQDSNHLMITHGLIYLIACSDKKWSSSTLVKCTTITAAGISQLLAGGYFLVNEKKDLGNLLFLEGISDITYGIKGFYHGRCTNYTEHKIKSIGFSTAASAASLSLNFVQSASIFKEILTSPSMKTIRTALPILSAIPAFNFNNSSPVNYQDETYFVVDEIIDDFKTLLQKTFKDNNNDLRRLLINGIQAIGAENLINKDGVFKTFIQPPLFDLCFFMASHLRQMIIENKEITTKAALKSAATSILTSEDSTIFLGKLSENMQSIMDYCKKDLCAKINDSIGINLVDNLMIENQVDAFIKQWKGEIEEKGTLFLKNQLENPLNLDENDAEAYQKQLYFIASNAYFNLKKHVSVNVSNELLFKKYDDDDEEEETKNDDLKSDEFKNNYYAKLEELQTKVRNPQIYVSTMNESLKINFYGSEAISRLTKTALNLSINVSNDYNDDGVSDNHVTICCNNDENEKEPENLYNQMSHQIPEFENRFPDEHQFLDSLSAEIASILELLHDFHIK